MFQVRKVCGRAELRPSNGGTVTDAAATGKSTSTGLEMHAAAPSATHRTLPTQLHVQLGNFLASVVRSRTFYGTLADTICEEYPDRRCWNGERIGEWVPRHFVAILLARFRFLLSLFFFFFMSRMSRKNEILFTYKRKEDRCSLHSVNFRYWRKNHLRQILRYLECLFL